MNRISLQLDDSGLLSFSGWNGEEAEVWCEERYIGPLSSKLGGVDMRALRLNADAIALANGQLTMLSETGSASGVLDVSLLLELMSDGGIASRMTALVGTGKWALYSIGIRSSGGGKNTSSEVTARLGIVLPPDYLNHEFDVLCEGRPALSMVRTSDPSLGRTHWYLPEGCVLSLHGTWTIEDLPNEISFTLRPKTGASPDWDAYRPLFTITQNRLPGNLPEIERIKRVSGPLATQRVYVNSGLTAFHRLSDIAKSHGLALDGSPRKLLDWGVGCGRVARHFSRVEGVEIAGLDIDGDNIDWCNAHLEGDYRLTDLHPPSSFEDGQFDLIYSCSVLSHLTKDAAHAWLPEIERLLAPGGLAFLSFNGSSNLASYLSRRPKLFQAALQTGFNDGDVNTELDGFIPGKDYYRQTFATDGWWQAMFEQYFELIAVERAVVNGHQNIAVLKARS